MHEMHLAGIDLNLLVTLDALLTEHSVTRAAARLGLSQSAVSHALGRLRELFSDPLLVRGRGGMLMTPRAESLIMPLRRGLADLGRVVASGATFDPGRDSRRFFAAATDYVEATLLPPLLAHVTRTAPGVDLDLRPLAADLALALESGDLDVAMVAYRAPEAPGLRQKKLFAEDFVCVARRDHPAIDGDCLDLDTYTALAHALIAPSGRAGSVVDAALAELGRSRRVALRVPHFLVAPLVVAGSDLILTCPRRTAQALARTLPLTLLEPPLSLPAFDVWAVWHERYQHDPAHAWLRAAIQTASDHLLSG